jgi:hypothetical protein
MCTVEKVKYTIFYFFQKRARIFYTSSKNVPCQPGTLLQFNMGININYHVYYHIYGEVTHESYLQMLKDAKFKNG